MKFVAPHKTSRYWLVMLCICMQLGCSKQYIQAPDLIEQKIIQLTGNNGAYTSWRCSSVQINSVIQPMTPGYADYRKTYNLNGSFVNSDGMKGYWSLVSKDSLTERVTNNNPPGVYAFQGYRVISLTNTALVLSYMANNERIEVSYAAQR